MMTEVNMQIEFRSIKDAAIHYGASQLRFKYPLQCGSSLAAFGLPLMLVNGNSPEHIVMGMARQDLRANRIVMDGYKVCLYPTDEEVAKLHALGYTDQSIPLTDYYQSDYKSLAQEYPDRYGLYVNDNHGKLIQLKFVW